jgi:hypothetical protein
MAKIDIDDWLWKRKVLTESQVFDCMLIAFLFLVTIPNSAYPTFQHSMSSLREGLLLRVTRCQVLERCFVLALCD